jgi:hypothetical protein
MMAANAAPPAALGKNRQPHRKSAAQHPPAQLQANGPTHDDETPRNQ